MSNSYVRVYKDLLQMVYFQNVFGTLSKGNYLQILSHWSTIIVDNFPFQTHVSIISDTIFDFQFWNKLSFFQVRSGYGFNNKLTIFLYNITSMSYNITGFSYYIIILPLTKSSTPTTHTTNTSSSYWDLLLNKYLIKEGHGTALN